MLGSNQHPLPCEGRSITSWLFATVQKFLQNRLFASGSIRDCSPLFVWVGVLLVYTNLVKLAPMALCKPCEPSDIMSAWLSVAMKTRSPLCAPYS